MWEVLFVNRREMPTNDGECLIPPAARCKTIRVYNKLTGERLLEVIIHEFLHAADWSKDEEWVERVAADLARFLWRLGYRGPTDG